MPAFRLYARSWAGLALSMLSLVGITATRARADEVLDTQLMMQTAVNDGIFIYTLFGPDRTSPMAFTSTVDAVANTFSYSINSGVTYQGMSITLSGSGSFDAITGILTTSSSGTLGSTSWTTSGTESMTAVVGGYSGSLDANVFEHLVKEGDIHETGMDTHAGQSNWTGYLTDANGNKIPNSGFTEQDFYNPLTGKWDKLADEPDPGFLVRANGYSPIAGGSGTFTMTVETVPEPTSLSLLCCGCCGLLVYTCHLRRRASLANRRVA